MDVTIRTITLAIGDPHPLDGGHFERAAALLRGAQARAEAAGYLVQTIRIATRPLLEDLAAWQEDALEAYAAEVQALCDDQGIAYCSLGPAPADDPSFSLERVAVLPRLLAPNAALAATVQLASAMYGPRYEAALATALAMRDLAERGGGEANFRFAALAMCSPGGPFFPQAYTRGPEWRLAVGLQSADLVRRVVEGVVARSGPGALALAELPAALASALGTAARPVVELVRAAAEEAGIGFAGIDLSPAPMGEESIGAAIEALGFGAFGAPGTLAVTAALTAAIRGTDAPICGYTGLMLPVLEDRVIGERCAEGLLDARALLAYSAVCGTGLDTVPLPLATPPERVAALLVDVAALATRLNKPLSARLFLVPDGEAGQRTSFTSPYLTNTRILPL